MKILISPDSFKGTMSSVDVAQTIETALKELDASIETVCLPVADGGEGTLHAFVSATRGQLIDGEVFDPLGRKINAQYGVLGDGITCVIEMAQASGIMLVSEQDDEPTLDYEEIIQSFGKMPSTFKAFFPIILPIVLK